MPRESGAPGKGSSRPVEAYEYVEELSARITPSSHVSKNTSQTAATMPPTMVPANAIPWPSCPVRCVYRIAMTPKITPAIEGSPQNIKPTSDATNEPIAMPLVPGGRAGPAER